MSYQTPYHEVFLRPSGVWTLTFTKFLLKNKTVKQLGSLLKTLFRSSPLSTIRRKESLLKLTVFFFSGLKNKANSSYSTLLQISWCLIMYFSKISTIISIKYGKKNKLALYQARLTLGDVTGAQFFTHAWKVLFFFKHENTFFEPFFLHMLMFSSFCYEFSVPSELTIFIRIQTQRNTE